MFTNGARKSVPASLAPGVWSESGISIQLWKRLKSLLACWKSSAVPFSLAVSLLLVTTKINSSWSFAWKLIWISALVICFFAPDQNPLAVSVSTPRHRFCNLTAEGCCNLGLPQGLCQEKIKEAPADSARLLHIVVPCGFWRYCVWDMEQSVLKKPTGESRDKCRLLERICHLCFGEF